jgi:nickel-type superoxide dismutase maturation protease
MSLGTPQARPEAQRPEEPQTLRHSRPLDWLLWLLRRRRRRRVAGRSMLPLLPPGTEILMHPAAYRKARPQPGDLVVAQAPGRPNLHLIKWVVFVETDGRCFLQGLNRPESTDSRQFGLVAPAALLGQVTCRFP